MAFVHLHVHTEYSDLDGMIRVKDLFSVAASHGQTASAITDHGTLGAMWTAQKHADDAGVKLIAGAEFYLANGSRFDKTPFIVPSVDNSTDEDSERGGDDGSGPVKFLEDKESGRKARPYQHLTVLATSPAGWRNLVILNNEAQTSRWSKPRIDMKLLAEHAEGIIVLTGCLGGPVIGPLSHAKIALDEAAAVDARLAQRQAAMSPAVASSFAPMPEDADQGAPAVFDDTLDEHEHDHAHDPASVLSTADAAARAEIVALRRRAHALHEEAREYRQAAQRNIDGLIAAVGRENVYVEVMDHGIAEESAIMQDVVDLARHNTLPIVATNDAHHTHEGDAQAQAAWLLVQSKSTLVNPKFQFHGSGYWLKTEEEMRAVRPEPWWQEACDNTQVIADRVADRVLPGHRDLLPKFPTPDGFGSNREFMYSLLRDGARRIYGGISRRVRDRIRTEMEVIEESGYVDYFLVVHDLIHWCLNNGILVGPGRGSAGGSLVAYLMGITRVDPLRYNLLFERFLERGRQEPPDIDIDFPQSRRDDVIQYLRDRWGQGNVAFIGTYQIARSRAAIKDAARVLGQGTVGNKMSALVPLVGATPMGMGDMLDPDQAAAAEYRRYMDKTSPVDENGRPDDGGVPAGRRVHELAAAFENVVKGVGIHASGIIVSAVPLQDLVPMRRTKRGWALQWTGSEAEQVGLLKVDVLGLRNLDIVAKAVDYIAQTTGETIDPLALPDPDAPVDGQRARVQKAWQVIGDGRTEGLFQLESPKMTELAQDVAPQSLNDLSALVALFRPGPMGKGLHTEYAARKRNPDLVSYRDYTDDPAEQKALAGVLGETHGILVYQEQVMMIGTVVAGFDAASRSRLRKAVSKKKKDVMEVVGAQFRDGAPLEHRDESGAVISIPFSPTTVQTLWESMVSFAEYAFNRSHSATYGYLAYITAFLKGNWPVEFAAATLAVTSGTEKRLQVLRSLRREGIHVLAPDVNAGNADTAPAGEGTIRIGLSEVKNLKDAGARIAQVRNEDARPFTSIGDLYSRVTKPASEEGEAVQPGSAVTSAHVRSLIEAGAMDQWCDGHRLGLLAVAGAGKTMDIPAPPIEWSTLERASRQRDALGLIVGTHPLTVLQDQVRAYQPFNAADGWNSRASVSIVPISRIPDADGATCMTIGVLAGWAEKAYSKGRMASILLEGSNASVSGTMWDRELSEHVEAGAVPDVGQVVAVTGRVRFRTIASSSDDPDAEEHVVKELQISRVRIVPISEPPRDEWPADDTVPVPMLARDAFDYAAEEDANDDEQSESQDTPAVAERSEQAVSLPDTFEEPAAGVAIPSGIEEQAERESMSNIVDFDQKRAQLRGTPAPEWLITVGPVPAAGGVRVSHPWSPFHLTTALAREAGVERAAAKRCVDRAQELLGAKPGTVTAVHSESGMVCYIGVLVTELALLEHEVVLA